MRSLYANSGPKAEGVPTNNKRGHCDIEGPSRGNTDKIAPCRCQRGTSNNPTKCLCQLLCDVQLKFEVMSV